MKKAIERREINKNMEVKLAKVEQKLDDACGDISELKAKFNTFDTKIDNFINSADNRYAPAWITWFIKLWIAGLLTAAFGLIVFLFQRHIL